MYAVKLRTVITKDGEIRLKDLPYKKGEDVECILLLEPSTKSKKETLTAKKLLHSGLVGMWKHREDIKDSSSFARKLRQKAQQRRRGE